MRIKGDVGSTAALDSKHPSYSFLVVHFQIQFPRTTRTSISSNQKRLVRISYCLVHLELNVMVSC